MIKYKNVGSVELCILLIKKDMDYIVVVSHNFFFEL